MSIIYTVLINITERSVGKILWLANANCAFASSVPCDIRKYISTERHRNVYDWTDFFLPIPHCTYVSHHGIVPLALIARSPNAYSMRMLEKRTYLTTLIGYSINFSILWFRFKLRFIGIAIAFKIIHSALKPGQLAKFK